VRYLSTSPRPAGLADYPFLAAELGATAETADQVAQIILNLATRWRDVGARLEGARRSAIRAIETAAARREIDAAEASFAGVINAL